MVFEAAERSVLLPRCRWMDRLTETKFWLLIFTVRPKVRSELKFYTSRNYRAIWIIRHARWPLPSNPSPDQVEWARQNFCAKSGRRKENSSSLARFPRWQNLHFRVLSSRYVAIFVLLVVLCGFLALLQTSDRSYIKSFMIKNNLFAGVHTRNGDIDTLCVVPGHVSRQDFFSTFFELLKVSFLFPSCR